MENKDMQQQGSVIVLYGTGSSGKTSIVQHLQSQFSNSVSLSIDDILWPNFMSKAQDLGLLDESMSTEHKQTIVMDHIEQLCSNVNWLQTLQQLYDRARDLAFEGKTVILDTVFGIVENQDYDYFVQAMDGVSVVSVLVYCSPLKLSEHICARNALGKKTETRDALIHMKGFLGLYTPAKSSKVVVDTLTQREVDAALQLVEQSLMQAGKSHACVQQEVHALQESFITTFFDEKSVDDSVSIVSRFPCDMMVNTGHLASLECAQLIYDYCSFIK